MFVHAGVRASVRTPMQTYQILGVSQNKKLQAISLRWFVWSIDASIK